MRSQVVFAVMLALAAGAVAQERQILARVVSVEGKTVTVEVMKGYLVPSATVEVWSEGCRRTATVTLSTDLLNEGGAPVG